MKLAVLLAAALLLFAACDERAGAPRTSPTPRTSPSLDLRCEEQADALTDPDVHELTGDVNGDGSPERIVIAEAEAGCPPLMIVEGESEALTLTIEEEGSSLGLPRLVALVEIDDRPGAEIAAALVAGASTEFFGAYSVVGGELARLRIAGPGRFGDLFPSGGSVGHLDATDCADGGRIVISSAEPLGDRYLVERRFYEVEEGVLRRASRGDRLVGFDELQTIPEFGSTPFGSCPPG